MADNFLERREEQLRLSHPPTRGNGIPNLEQMLERCIAAKDLDTSYKVHSLQLESIVNVAQKYCSNQFVFNTLQDTDSSFPKAVSTRVGYSAAILICSSGLSCCESFVELGQTIMVLRLKAAQMNLCSEVFFGNFDLPNRPLAILAIGKKL